MPLPKFNTIMIVLIVMIVFAAVIIDILTHLSPSQQQNVIKKAGTCATQDPNEPCILTNWKFRNMVLSMWPDKVTPLSTRDAQYLFRSVVEQAHPCWRNLPETEFTKHVVEWNRNPKTYGFRIYPPLTDKSSFKYPYTTTSPTPFVYPQPCALTAWEFRNMLMAVWPSRATPLSRRDTQLLLQIVIDDDHPCWKERTMVQFVAHVTRFNRDPKNYGTVVYPCLKTGVTIPARQYQTALDVLRLDGELEATHENVLLMFHQCPREKQP